MPTVAETLLAFFPQAPGDKAASWDPHGLQIGDSSAEVRTIGVCHEVTQEVVDQAIGAPVDLLVTYHPLLFRPLSSLVAGPGAVGRAYRLLRAGVAVATIHTAWDAAPGGTSDSLAATLRLSEVRGFGPLEQASRIKLVTFVPSDHVDQVAAALSEAGAGQIGNYGGCSFRSEGTGTFLPGQGASPVLGRNAILNQEKETRLEMIADRSLEARLVAALVAAHPYEEPAFDVYEARSNAGLVGRVGSLPGETSLGDLAAAVASNLAGSPRISGDLDDVVRTVAVVPGSGGSLVADAAATGAQLYLTGDMSHHQTVEARDRGLAVIDPGHAASERPGVAALLGAMSQLGITVVDLTVDPTPWRTP